MDAANDPVQLVGTLMSGFVDSRCVHVVANLGVADVIGDEPMPIAEVAGTLGVDAGSLTRLLRHLVTLGLFSIDRNTVTHNEASRLLRSDHPQGMLSLAQMMALPLIWDSARHLEDAVRTGRPGTTFLDQRGFFGYLANHSDESAVCDRGMTATIGAWNRGRPSARRQGRDTARPAHDPGGKLLSRPAARSRLLRDVQHRP